MMMRRITILVLVLVCAIALLPGGAEARPKGLGGLLGIITNPIGSILGAAQRTGRRAIPHRRSSASRHRNKPAPAAAAVTAAGAAGAVSTSAAATPGDSATAANNSSVTVSGSVPSQPTPPDNGPTDTAKTTQVSVTTPDAVPMPPPAPDPIAPPNESKRAAPALARRLGLTGPAAWPSALEDVVGYALWPRDYAGRLRVHGVGDVLATAFTPPGVLLANAQNKPESRRVQRTAHEAATCDTAGAAVEDWPAHEIAQSLDLDVGQRAALDELKTAIGKGVEAVRRSCRETIAPVDRLRAMEASLWAVHDAAQAIRAPLAKFYDSLTAEQKKKFAAPADDSQSSGHSDLVRICTSPHELPKKHVEQSLHTTKSQRASLEALQKKSFEMGQFLMASCLRPIAATPAERLDAAAERLTAVIFAASSLSIALNDFTGQLSGEQKSELEKLAQ